MITVSIRKILLTAALVVTVAGVEGSFGQNVNRSTTMRQAQSRARQNRVQPAPVRNDRTRVARSQNVPTPINSSPVGGGGAPVVSPSAPIVGGPSSPVGGFVPQHLSGATGQGVVSHGPVVDGGSPVVSDGYYGDGYIGGDAGFVDDGCGGCDGGCGAGCGVGQSYFDCGPCGNRIGGCGPEYWQNCWLWGLGGLFQNAELMAGAQGFRSRNFTAGNQLVDDASFGFYGGLNLGLSLCPLTCGLFSGQIGIRSVQSEFDGEIFSSDNRDQLFVTAGIFRRVDYGLQMGVVGDFLHEEWFTETDLAQIRGDISWVYPGGNALGFRITSGTEDDVTSGIINGQAFNNLFAEVIDTYRFYYRATAANGGFCDLFAGWSDADHAVLGLDFDMPLNGLWAMQSGFTYLLPDVPEGTAMSTQDAWNVYVGLSLRPQGPLWYGNYDRPLFNVADNGTFVFGRN